MSETERAAPRRIVQTILNPLQSGMVPRVGLPHIAVGRKEEIAALFRDTELIAEGGASFRFLIGKYDTGKSLLLQTIRNYVFEQGFVAADADLSPERRLQDSKGQGLATYHELVADLATETKPEGSALRLILDRWVSRAERRATEEQGGLQEDSALFSLVEKKVAAAVDVLQDMVHGFEFAKFLRGYYLAGAEGDGGEKGRILKWFRGEYENKHETRKALGINLTVSNENWYNYLRLFSQFFRHAGYASTLILLGEAADLCKIPNAIARQYNYKVLLAMYDDMIQGKVQHTGIWMGATPEALEDRRRGLSSYEALSSRLAGNCFSRMGSKDLFSPALRLEALTPEEMLVLTEKPSAMYATLYGDARCSRADELELFMRTCYMRVGASVQLTPREMTHDFIFLLDALYREPENSMEQLLKPEAGGAALESVANELREAGGGDDAPFDFSF